MKKSLPVFATACAFLPFVLLATLLFGVLATTAFGGQIYLNVNLPDLQMSAGSSEGDKGGETWSQVYASLQITFGEIQNVGVYYNPEYIYDLESGKYNPSPNKGWVNITFSGPEVPLTATEDYRSQQLSLTHNGINLTESVSSYAYQSKNGEMTLMDPIWSSASGNFYGNFHIIGGGNASFSEYSFDSDGVIQNWFTANASVPVQWDVAPGVLVPAMLLASSPVPEPSMSVMMLIGLIPIIGWRVWRRLKR